MASFDFRAAGQRKKSILLRDGWGLGLAARSGMAVPSLQITATSILESANSGSTVGVLSVVNGSGSYTFTKTADPDAKFAISGTNLNTAAALNFETATSHSVTIQASNGVDTPISRTFTISVTNVFEAPSLSALTGTFSLAENAALNAVAGAISGKTSGSTLSLTDNAGGRVALSGTNIVRGATALDYETATSHSFTVRETLADSANSPRDTTLTLTVTDIDEIAPTITSANPSGSIAENTTVSGTLTANETVTWSKSGTDAALITLNTSTGAWSITSTPNFESKSSYSWTFTATDAAGNATNQVVAITITNVFEAASLSALTLPGSVTAGTTINITGATSGSTITGTVPSGWTINSGARTITVSGGAATGSQSWSLVETLADSANSPRTSSGSSTVSAAGGGTSAIMLMVTGQSNARSATTSAQTAPSKYTGALGTVKILFPGTGANRLAEIAAATWVDYVPGVGGTSDPYNTGSAWGSELEFIYQMRQGGDTRPVYIVKEAQNGQNVSSDWNPSTTNDNFEYLEAQVARARALLSAASVTLADEINMWNQGEADANFDATANAYATNFGAVVSAFRSRVSSTALFIGERIRPIGYAAGDGTGEGAGWIRAWTVRESMLAVLAADSRAAAIDLDFDPTNFAQIHPFTPAGFDWVEGKGLRCYATWKGTHNGTYGSLYDTTPAAFTIADITGAALSSVTTSSAVLITGYQRRTAISVSGGEYRLLNSLNSDAVVQDWTSATGTIDPYMKVQLRATSSSSNSTAVNVTLTIGGVSDTWSVTTEAAGAAFEAETTAFVAKATGLGAGAFNSTQKDALDDLYVALKAAGLLSGKVLRLFTSNMPDSIAATIDLVDQNRTLTAAGSAATWAKLGWTAEDVTGRGYIMGNPSTMGLTLNSCGLFVWDNVIAVDSQQEVNSNDSTFGMRIVSAVTRSQTHAVANAQLTGRTNVPGFYAAYRSASNLTTLYGPDGAAQGTASTASSAITATAVSIHASFAGQLTSGTAQVRAAGVLGAGVTASDILALRNALNTYFAAFG